MVIFYLSLRVTPNLGCVYAKQVAGAIAACWVREENPLSAIARASFMVRRYGWTILNVEDPPVPTARENFSERDIGLEQYDLAQEQGIAIVFGAWSKDGKSSFGPVTLERLDDFALQSYLGELKRLRQKGRCLHFESGRRCARVINAHSIQKNGALSGIAENGEVYAISMNFGDLKRNKGAVTYVRQGINKVSTFRGFCQHHDNQLFEPIDKAPLVPTRQQVLLYAYRALCREIYLKENALSLFGRWADRCLSQEALHELFSSMHEGTKHGLDNLMRQKAKFDASLRSQSFVDIKSVLFCSQQSPTTVFSGVFYPDCDFTGMQLQDLDDHSSPLDMITLSFSPMESGWGILFAWHSDSSETCDAFVKSLAAVVDGGSNLGDYLFRLVVSNCENVAMRPQWWESLTEQQRSEIATIASYWADVFSPLRRDYLVRGLENISNWQFDQVISDIQGN